MTQMTGLTSLPRMTFEEFRPGLWLKPEWLLREPRPKVSEVLRLLGS
jgi:hypothetical protein